MSAKSSELWAHVSSVASPLTAQLLGCSNWPCKPSCCLNIQGSYHFRVFDLAAAFIFLFFCCCLYSKYSSPSYLPSNVCSNMPVFVKGVSGNRFHLGWSNENLVSSHSCGKGWRNRQKVACRIWQEQKWRIKGRISVLWTKRTINRSQYLSEN